MTTRTHFFWLLLHYSHIITVLPSFDYPLLYYKFYSQTQYLLALLISHKIRLVFFGGGVKLVPRIWLFLFFDIPKVMVWVLLTNIYIIFKSYFYKTTLHCPCNLRLSGRRWQREITVCFVHCISTLIILRCYIVLINLVYIINCLFELNFHKFCHYHCKDVK